MARNTKQDSAKRAALREWDAWALVHAKGVRHDGHHAMLFFQYLQRERSDLLPAGNGDKWQTVHGWLLQDGKVSN